MLYQAILFVVAKSALAHRSHDNPKIELSGSAPSILYILSENILHEVEHYGYSLLVYKISVSSIQNISDFFGEFCFGKIFGKRIFGKRIVWTWSLWL